MLESPQEQSNDPSNWGTRSTQKFPPKITSIKHPITFAVNYKNDSNIMVERDNSIVFQQNSKEPQTKKNNHNQGTMETKKLVRTIGSSIMKIKSYNLNKSSNNKEILHK